MNRNNKLVESYHKDEHDSGRITAGERMAGALSAPTEEPAVPRLAEINIFPLVNLAPMEMEGIDVSVSTLPHWSLRELITTTTSVERSAKFVSSMPGDETKEEVKFNVCNRQRYRKMIIENKVWKYKI